MAFPALPNWSSRNPLSILALFIALIYGMAALLFGVAVKSLAVWNQTILVIFLVLFPAAVLWVFAWLVSRHHSKLYSPGEFRSDDGFYNNPTPANFGARLEASDSDANLAPSGTARDEVVPVLPEPDTAHEVEPRLQPPSVSGEESVQSPSKNALLVGRGDASVPNALASIGGSAAQRQAALVAETLALQELQQEFNGPVRRDVVLAAGNKRVSLDGVIELDGKNIGVEILMVWHNETLKGRLRRVSDRLSTVHMHCVVVLVVDESRASMNFSRNIAVEIFSVFPNIEVRTFGLNELMRKFGLE